LNAILSRLSSITSCLFFLYNQNRLYDNDCDDGVSKLRCICICVQRRLRAICKIFSNRFSLPVACRCLPAFFSPLESKRGGAHSLSLSLSCIHRSLRERETCLCMRMCLHRSRVCKTKPSPASQRDPYIAVQAVFLEQWYIQKISNRH
jgi:hypothetical protein